jgi:hypothetical protein
MKYFTLSFLLFLNLAFLTYSRVESVDKDKIKEEKLSHLIMEMKFHNDKMAEWIEQARQESDPDFHQWMIEQAIESASKYSECKGVLRYINTGKMP